MDDKSAESSAAEESSVDDEHLPPDDSPQSAEPMEARVARLLTHGFPH